MARTVHSLFRIASIVATLLVIAAIGLGRLSLDPDGRRIAPGLLVGIAPRIPGPAAGELPLLDLKAQAIHSIPLSPTDRIDLAIGSPWVDSWDQAHVVGRWMSVTPDGILQAAGLARLAYPSGRVLDQVALERYPTTEPCWGTGTSSRVLYPSGDGSLYRFDFDAKAGAPEFEGQPGLHRVEWVVDAPGHGDPVILDVGRPEGCLPPDLLLATVVIRSPDQTRGGAERSQLWWLRLDREERKIIAWGVVAPEDPQGKDIGRRRPTLARRADGSLRLAYLSWNGVPDRMALRVAPARIDERTGGPVAVGAGVPLAEGCLSIPLTFTECGTRLTCLTFEHDRPSPLRIALDETPSPTALAVAGIPPGF
jgi:hypothetical protein